MQTNEQLLDLLENYLAQRELPTEPERLYDPIRYSLAGGGKRLRPMLLLLSCGLFADDVDVALPAAAAVEIFHNFTLLHDDIMDNAAVRRGKPSVYALPRILEVFNTMALGVCEGQQYDMDFESKQKVSVVEYMSMIELKTSVLVAGSAMMGAILGGADEEQSRRLYQFAIELGMAFQLQDDLLDSYGGEELGKTIGGDILEGKKSYLMVTAMSRADEEQREVLRHTYKDAALAPAEKIARVRAVFDALDVPRLTEQQISLRFDRALATLDGLNVPDARKEPLREYARSLMGRRK